MPLQLVLQSLDATDSAADHRQVRLYQQIFHGAKQLHRCHRDLK